MEQLGLSRLMEKSGGDDRLSPTHLSLFIAVYSCSDAGRPERSFRVTRRRLMSLSRIRSIATYHKCIRELVDFGYIRYFPSYHPTEASSISMVLSTSQIP